MAMDLCMYLCLNVKYLANLVLDFECLDLCLALNVGYLALGLALSLRCLLTRLQLPNSSSTICESNSCE
jgi:hypothetical protein